MFIKVIDDSFVSANIVYKSRNDGKQDTLDNSNFQLVTVKLFIEKGALLLLTLVMHHKSTVSTLNYRPLRLQTRHTLTST